MTGRNDTIPSVLDAVARRRGPASAIRVEQGETISFEELRDASISRAHGLMAAGVTPGERVVIVADRRAWIDYASTYLGVLRAGAVAVPIPADMPARQLGEIVTQVGATRTLICSSGSAAIETPSLALPLPALRGDATADIIFTSGSTGRSAGVASTHAAILASTGGPPPMWHGKKLFHCFPPASAAGTQGALLMQLLGGLSATVMPQFNPRAFGDLVRRQQIEILYLVPSLVTMIVGARDTIRNRLGSVQTVLITGARLPADVFSAFVRLVPQAQVISLYGLTEGGGAQVLLPYDRRRADSLGKPLGQTRIRICGPDGVAVAAGETGEIQVRREGAPQRSYYGDPELTEAVFVQGWTRTGDLGYLDAEGYLYLVDRAKDIIVIGGVNVSSHDLETELRLHAAVSEAAVVAVPDRHAGERRVAFGVPPVGPAEVREFLAARLPAWKLPRIVVVDNLPLNAMGKVDKPQLRQTAVDAA